MAMPGSDCIYVCSGNWETREVKSCQSIITYNQTTGSGFRLKGNSQCFLTIDDAISARVMGEEVLYCTSCDIIETCEYLGDVY